MRHNHSSVLLPAGVTRARAKQLLPACKALGERPRQALAWVLDQAPDFVITVGGIRAYWRWGEARWVSVRKQLVQTGVLAQSRVVLADGSSHWTLTFDFNQVFQEAVAEKPRDHVRVRVIPTKSRDRTRVPDPPPVPGI